MPGHAASKDDDDEKATPPQEIVAYDLDTLERRVLVSAMTRYLDEHLLDAAVNRPH